MKNFLLCLTVSSFLFNLSVAQETSVLFIGNSYIYTANLPGTLKSLALAGGDSIYHESSTPGGYTFEGHSTNASTLSKISSRNWDFVVLQQQSQMPSFPPSQVASQTYPFAEILVDSIKSNYTCSEPVFFMTWGRRDGDPSNCAGYPPLCTFEGMNARLRQSYLEMGADNDATVAPCGAAWHQISLDNNSFWSGLYSGDGSHPSAWGTYLNACVFYATIFRKSPVGIPFYSNIGQQDAEDLQQLAEDIVLDSLSNWYIGHQDVVSNATYTYENGFTVNFDGSSENETSHEWSFGNGSESTQESPQYTYPTNGVYEVTHIATSLCGADTTSFELLVEPLGIEKNPLKQIEVFAANGALTFKNVLNSNIQIELMDLTGRVVLKTTVNSKATNSVQIPAEQGIYLVQLTEGELQWTKKVFIN